ncbi:MAG: MMPL family transporter [Nitrospirota bacterium]|nr:MMPL family transporter [Nitrospirota bacterium]
MSTPTPPKGSARKFGAWVIRWRWAILVTVPLLVVAMTSGAKRLTFNDDYKVFFAADNPELLAFEQVQNTYVKNETVLFALAPKDGNAFSRATLGAVRELTEASWQVPHSLRVDSLTNFQHTYARGDELVVEDLIPDLSTITDVDLERRKELALAEPLLLNRAIPPAADVTGITVTVQLPDGNSSTAARETMAEVHRLLEEARAAHPDITYYLSGTLTMNAAFAEATEQDMRTLVPLMFGAIVLLTLFLTRTITGTVGTLLIMAFSMLSAMGLFGWWNGRITPPVASGPTIILTLGVANSIHILMTMLHEMHAGKSKHDAIVESMRVNLWPVFLTCATTAIGFLSMNAADVPPFRDLGNLVAGGVMLVYVFSIFFLPAFLAVLPVRVRVRPDGERHLLDHTGEFVVKARRPLMWIMLVVVAVLSVGISRIEVNDNFVQYFDERYAFRTDTDFVTSHLTGIAIYDYSLDSGKEEGISDPRYLTFLEDFAVWLRQQPEVAHVNVLTDVVKRLNRNMHADDPAFYTIPENRQLAAQYLLLYEMSVPFGLDLNNQVNVSRSASKLTVTYKPLTTRMALDVEHRAAGWLAEHMLPEYSWQLGSPTVMFAHVAFRNINSMIGGTLLALVLISGLIIGAVRSLKIGLISLVPNLVPVAMAFGLWGLTVSRVGLATSVVAAMALGIVVDDSIHFLSKYLRGRREHGLDEVRAVRYAFHVVGTPIVFTSIILVGGFFVLALSGFQLNQQLGLLTGATLLFALLADLLLLPPLLMLLDRSAPPAPETGGHPASIHGEQGQSGPAATPPMSGPQG